MTVGDNIANLVKSKLGCPYEYGATGPDSFDCSGLAYWAHLMNGIPIPRTSLQQSNGGSSVGSLEPGDLVFFVTSGSQISHVGVYIGNNQFIHAPKPGDVVKTASLSSSYWQKAYRHARRYW